MSAGATLAPLASVWAVGRALRNNINAQCLRAARLGRTWCARCARCPRLLPTSLSPQSRTKKAPDSVRRVSIGGRPCAP